MVYSESEEKRNSFDNAGKIHLTLINCGTKHMLLFLQYTLQNIDTLNVEFLSEYLRLHKLYLTVSSEYKDILSFCIKEYVLNSIKLFKMDPKNRNNY